MHKSSGTRSLCEPGSKSQKTELELVYGGSKLELEPEAHPEPELSFRACRTILEIKSRKLLLIPNFN